MKASADKASADIMGLYERHAQAWIDDRTGPMFEQAWLDRFCALLPPGGSILDLGCGSGHLSAYFIGLGFGLTGVDSSASLIAHCRRRFPAQDWRAADMRTLALAQKFTGLIAWDSSFHLSPEDQRAMFPIFRAHAAERAALMFTSHSAFAEVIGAYRGDPLYHASLDPAEYRALLEINGFSVVSYVADDPSCGHHTVWLAQMQ